MKLRHSRRGAGLLKGSPGYLLPPPLSPPALSGGMGTDKMQNRCSSLRTMETTSKAKTLKS